MDAITKQILQAIVDFCNEEYCENETVEDIKDLDNIGVMYCTFDEWEDDEQTVWKGEHDVQWVIDLEKNPYEMRLYVDDLMEVSPAAVRTFTPEEMLAVAKDLYWDDLYYEACCIGKQVLEQEAGQ